MHIGLPSNEALQATTKGVPRLRAQSLAEREVVGSMAETTESSSHRVFELLRQAKALAKEYYRITGKPLGITGEVAEFEAARLLGVELSIVRQTGYDAIRRTSHGSVRLQIKGRCFAADGGPGQRLGSIQLDKEWDAVLMVLLDPDFEAREIWEAYREPIAQVLTKPGSVARNERGAMAVNQFKRIGRLLWKRGGESPAG